MPTDRPNEDRFDDMLRRSLQAHREPVPAGFTATTPIAFMLALILVGGFFRSLQFTSMSALTFADVQQKMMSGASTITGVAQQLSLSLGVSVGAMAVETTLHVTGAPLGAETFAPAFIIVGLVSLISIVPLVFLAADAGDEVSRRRRPGSRLD